MPKLAVIAAAVPRSTHQALQDIVRIARLAAEGTEGGAAHGQLGEVGFGENEGAGLAELLDHSSPAAAASGRGRPTTGGREIRGVVVVFDNHGNAMQRPHGGRVAAILTVLVPRGFEGMRVHRDQRIEARPCLS